MDNRPARHSVYCLTHRLTHHPALKYSRLPRLAGIGLAILLFLLQTAPLVAQNDTPTLPDDTSTSVWVDDGTGAKSTWRGEVELGLLQTRGNQNTSQNQGQGRYRNDRERWRHAGRAEFLNQREDDGSLTEEYLAQQKSAIKLSAVDYLFGRLKWERRPESGYDQRTSEILGYGRLVVNNDRLQWELELGAGARQIQPTEGDDTNESVILLATDLNWDIRPDTTFNQSLSVDASHDNTSSESITSLTTNAVEAFSLRFSYILRQNTQVPVGVEKTDTTTRFTLVYSF